MCADGDIRQERVVATQLTGAIDNLQPATGYHVHITASNALGQSQPSVGLTVTTEEEAPEGPPLELEISAVNARGFTLSWAPPAARLQNGLIHSYLVTIDSGRALNRTIVPSSTEYVVAGLRPNTNYLVYVQAINSQGTGPACQSVSVKTSEDAPEEAPLNVACVALNSQSLQITWQPPRSDYRNGIVRGYRVFYEPLNDLILLSNDPTNEQISSSQTTAEMTVFLSNLQKFSNYSIQVCIYIFEYTFYLLLL